MSFLRVSYRAQLSAATSSLVSFYRDDSLKLARNNSYSDPQNASPASFCLYGWLDSVLHGYVESGLSGGKSTSFAVYMSGYFPTTTRTGRDEVSIAAYIDRA